MAGGLAVPVIGQDVTLVGGLRVGRASGAANGKAAAGELRIGLVGLVAELVIRWVAVSMAAVVVVGVEVVVVAREPRVAGIDGVVGAIGATGVIGATRGAGPVTGRGEAGSRGMGGQPAQ